MAAIQVIATAPLSLSVGAQAPLESAILDPAARIFIVRTTPVALLWPERGEVLNLVIEESPDAGESWFFSAANPLSGGPWSHPRAGGLFTQDVWTTRHLFDGTDRKLRLIIEALQACSAAFTVESA